MTIRCNPDHTSNQIQQGFFLNTFTPTIATIYLDTLPQIKGYAPNQIQKLKQCFLQSKREA